MLLREQNWSRKSTPTGGDSVEAVKMVIRKSIDTAGEIAEGLS
jgi:hypothetical protein